MTADDVHRVLAALQAFAYAYAADERRRAQMANENLFTGGRAERAAFESGGAGERPDACCVRTMPGFTGVHAVYGTTFGSIDRRL